jgi:hypothetical protein
VFSVRSVPRIYKKDKEGRLSRLSSGVGSCSRELRVSGVGSWQNNREEMARKELGCVKKTSQCAAVTVKLL